MTGYGVDAAHERPPTTRLNGGLWLRQCSALWISLSRNRPSRAAGRDLGQPNWTTTSTGRYWPISDC